MGIFSLFNKSNVLYFPGCITYFKYPNHFRLYQKIFSKLGIKFKILENQNCCGLPVLEAGYETGARRLARRNFENLNLEDIDTIITNSPCCYKMFLQNYPKIMPDWNIKVENIWEKILNSLKNKPHLIKDKAFEVIAFHDSCYLGRYCKIYNEPREILELIGYEIKELPDSKEESLCCGSCGGLTRTNSELADKIAREKILQAKRIGVKKLIVTSLSNYQLLKKNIKNNEIEILELADVLAKALGIKIEKELEEETISGEREIVLGTESNQNLEEELKEEKYYKKSK